MVYNVTSSSIESISAVPDNLFSSCKNLAPYLPGLLCLKGKPLSLYNHFVMADLYATDIVSKLVLRAGRQVSKSISLTALILLRSAAFDYHNSLIVLPLQEQADRLSSEYFKPMIEDSPIRLMLRDDSASGNIRRRSFTNRSTIAFLYAWLSAERVRGNPADTLAIDEAQDMDRAHMPVITSCTDASDFPEIIISGTSKTRDTMLEAEFQKSSQGIWHVKCRKGGCNFENVFCLEGGNILEILGPYSSDISEKRPGTVCAKCRTPINPRWGQWVHRYPSRLKSYKGFHIPQPLIPTHYAKAGKWLTLMDKYKNYSPGRFLNEILGEPYDFAVKLVSVDDLKKAGSLHENTPENALEASRQYSFKILSVDWGGGGEEGGSCTKFAVMGWASDGRCDVIYGKQFPPSTDHVNEVKEVIAAADRLQCQFIVHDYNGGGVTRESILTHSSWPIARIVPVVYCSDPEGPVIEFVPPKKNRLRGFWHLDKSRSLQYNCFALRNGLIRTFKYDWVSDENLGMLYDFTTLVEHPVESPTGVNHYRVRKAETAVSDDFAQAVNMGASVIWETMCNGQWPSIV